MNPNNHRYEVIIDTHSQWWKINWVEIWSYRDLLLLFIQREFISRYRQTVLGPAWFVIQPLLLTMVFTLVFGKFGGISTNGKPPILFYLAGLVTWGYFVQALNETAGSLIANAHLFNKVYFPRLIIPLAAILSKLLIFVTQFSFFLLILLYYKLFSSEGSTIQPNFYILMTPFWLLQAGLCALGVGLWIAALTVKYRDFGHITSFLIQLWLYATPIIYPVSRVPQKWIWIVWVNPMATVVEGYRMAFLGGGSVLWNPILFSFSFTIVILITGLMYFNRVERTFVDTV